MIMTTFTGVDQIDLLILHQATGPVAVITGASSGVGAATAPALSRQANRLALLARQTDRLQALANELGNDTSPIAADVTNRDALGRVS
jgi:NADP-dependent 3-hydroxy acid dehydrogenase YdfG